jgi:hypothetical protein
MYQGRAGKADAQDVDAEERQSVMRKLLAHDVLHPHFTREASVFLGPQGGRVAARADRAVPLHQVPLRPCLLERGFVIRIERLEPARREVLAQPRQELIAERSLFGRVLYTPAHQLLPFSSGRMFVCVRSNISCR